MSGPYPPGREPDEPDLGSEPAELGPINDGDELDLAELEPFLQPIEDQFQSLFGVTDRITRDNVADVFIRT